MKKILNFLNSHIQKYFFENFIGDRILPLVFNKLYKTTPTLISRSNLKRILVWNLDSLGDSLWIIPTIRVLKENYGPNVEITILCNKRTKQFFENEDSIEHVIGINPQIFYTMWGWFKEIPELRQHSFDLQLILEMGSRPADAGRLWGYRNRVKYILSGNLGLLKNISHFNLPPNTQKEGQWWPSYFSSILKNLDIINDKKLELHINIDSLSKDSVNRWISERNLCSRYIVIHPNVAPYALLTKKWPDEHYIKLIELIKEKYDCQIVITGSSDESNMVQQFIENIKKIIPNIKIYSSAGIFSIIETCELLKRSKIVICADTSILHMALAVKSNVIPIFGATDYRKIAPTHLDYCKPIFSSMICSPCHQTTDITTSWPRCIYKTPKCMEETTPEYLFGIIQQNNLITKD